MITVLASVTLLQWYDFSVDDGAMQEVGNTGQWEYGIPSDGPMGESNVWGTKLHQDYLADSFDTLELPLPSLAGVESAYVQIEHWYDIQPGSPGDWGTFQVRDGGEWMTIEPEYGYPKNAEGFSGKASDWVTDTVSLSGYSEDVEFRITFTSDSKIGRAGWYLASIGVWDGDVVPPSVVPLVLPEDTQDYVGPYPFSLEVVDNELISEASFFWWKDEEPPSQVALNAEGGGVYGGEIPGQLPTSEISWYVQISDGENTYQYPPDSAFSFRVYLAAPQNLRAEGERLVGQEIALVWEVPESPHAVLEYEVAQGAGEFLKCALPCQAAVDPDSPMEWRVRAIYDIDGSPIPGDATVPLSAMVAVPSVTSVYPDVVGLGDFVWLAVTGTDLFFNEEMALSFGEGLDVESVKILDSNQALVKVRVHGDAAFGFRTLALTGDRDWSFPGVIEVSELGAVPTIIGIDPGELPQGANEWVTMCPSEPFAGVVTVTPGNGIFVTDSGQLDGECWNAELAVGYAAPVGIRTLFLDDGLRVWPCEIEITETRLQAGCGCSSVTSASWGWLFAGLLVWRRRR